MKKKIIIIFIITIITSIALYASSESNNDKVKDSIINEEKNDIQIEDNTLIEPDEYTENEDIKEETKDNTFNESNNEKLKNTITTNEIIMPSEELLKLL